jgi:hypothetical protein
MYVVAELNEGIKVLNSFLYVVDLKEGVGV